MPMWTYRPTDAEHEAVLKAVKEGNFTSVAQFIREGTLRLAYDENLNSRYTEVEDLIEELKDLKDRFLKLLLDHTEDMGP